jgi:hypothetical protein
MNPLGTRARSEELARLLDGVSFADAGTTSAPYAAVAGRLRTLGTELAPGVAPRAEFRSALRTRLVAVASVQSATAADVTKAPTKSRALESAVSWSQTRRAQRGLGLAAGAMASVVAVAGVAVAGSQSLPGDPFYAVKRGGEALELRTTHGDVAKGSKHLQFAAERLREVRKLSLGRDAAFAGSVQGPQAASAFGGSASSRVRSALADMDRETRTGSDLLTSAYRASNSDSPLEILSHFAGQQTRDLQALLPDLPAGARPRAETSLALVSGVAVEASQLLAVGVCTGQCAPAQAAPSLPPSTGPMPQPAPSAATSAPCGCPAPARTPDPGTRPTPRPTPQPTAAPSPSPKPTASPSASPSSLPTTVPTSVPSTVPTTLPTILPTTLPTSLPTPLPLPLPVPVVPSISVPSLPAG